VDNSVRIYNADMKLVAVVRPELTFDTMKKFQPHICRNGKCGAITTNRHYCTADCRMDFRAKKEKVKRTEAKRVEELRTKKECTNKGCKEKLEKRKPKFCSRKCSEEAGVWMRREQSEISKRKLKEIRENGTHQQ